jgi:hypothetical protein
MCSTLDTAKPGNVEPWLDDAWERFGRGLTRQFYAVDQEVEDWLLSCLPTNLAPYSLLSREPLMRHGENAVDWQTIECAITDWAACRGSGTRWSWFIRSHVLTPALPLIGELVERSWLINGLVNLQHGLIDSRGRQRASSIGITSQIVHGVSGERRRNDGYVKVYRRLERRIRALARHPTVRTFPDGTTVVDHDLALMTDEARLVALKTDSFDVSAMPSG